MGFLEKHTKIGVTITDRVIEIVELTKQDGSFSVKNIGRTELEPSIVEGGLIKNPELLEKAFYEALLKARPEGIELEREVICALPNTYAYVLNISVPKDTDAAYEKHISKAISSSVPLEHDDVVFSYSVMEKAGGKEVVLLAVVTSEEVLAVWSDFFESLNVDVSFDVEALAAYRGVALPKQSRVVCFVHKSEGGVSISVFDKRVTYYTHAKRLAQETLLEEVADEIQDAVGYLKTTYKKDIDTILYTPSFAQEAEAIQEFFEKEFQYIVAEASPQVKDLANSNIATAGLALHSLEKKWSGLFPLISANTIVVPSQTKKESPVKEKEEEPDIESARAVQKKKKKLAQQKILLGALILIGVVGIAGAYLFRANEKAAQKENLETVTTQFTKSQAIIVATSIATNEEDYSETRVSGRISSHTIDNSGSYDEAVANAKRLAEKTLKSGELLWDTPINAPTDTKNVSFPLTVKWLVYSKEEADKLLLSKVDALNTEDTAYALSLIQVESIKQADTEGVYTLSATITVSLNELIKVASTTPDTAATKIGVITDTPTGWLNVRTGPGTNYDQIQRVLPGESYTILETSGDWYKIKLSEEKMGWTISTFVEIE